MAISWIKRLFELAGDQEQKRVGTPTRSLSEIKIPASDPIASEQITKSDDPLFGIKKGGKEVANKLFSAMSSERGIHLESLLCALGSMAGYACQVSVREEFVRQQGRLEKEVFIVVDSTQNGNRYFFGDLLNKPLAESKYSIWSLSSGASQKLGLTQLIDLHDIFRHVTDTLGQSSFGVPRLPDNHTARELPEDYVRHLWPQLFPLAQRYCEKPDQWPVLFGVAVQEILFASKGLIDPQIALKIVMESAVPMSKINLREMA